MIRVELKVTDLSTGLSAVQNIPGGLPVYETTNKAGIIMLDGDNTAEKFLINAYVVYCAATKDKVRLQPKFLESLNDLAKYFNGL